MEAPRSYEKFFPFAIHTVYAVVIAISFDISRTLVVPAWNIPDHLVNTGLLILSYFIIVTSWIGYYMTTRKDSYNSLRGIGRFTVDLFIIYIFYYLVGISEIRNSRYIPDVFIFVLPLLFCSYFIWDKLRIWEYKDTKEDEDKKNEREEDKKITKAFLTVFLAIDLLYFVAALMTQFNTFGFYASIRDGIFIIAALLLTFQYRRVKWKLATHSRVRKSKKL